MYASHLRFLLAAVVMAPAISFGSQANPFIPQPEGDMSGQLERRLETLENLARDTEYRIDELSTQFPGIDQAEFQTGVSTAPIQELTTSDVVVGTVNGKCLVKRTWAHGGTTLEALSIKGACVNQRDSLNALTDLNSAP